MKYYFRLLILLSSIAAFQASSNHVHAQSDDFGLSQNEQDILIGFGDLIDFTAIWDALESAVDALSVVVNNAWNTISPMVNTVGDAITNIGNAISATSGFQATVDALSSTVSGLQDIVDGIENAVPWMALDEDDAELSNIEAFETVTDLPDELIGGIEEGALDNMTLILPQVDDNGNPTNLIVLTNPEASLTETAASLYSESSTGNPWGDVWVNPTIIDPVFEGNVNGLDASAFGLGLVNNTSDLDKPISVPLEEALSSKIQISAAIPQSNISPCTVGEVASDDSYFYVCVAPNTWSRTNFDDSW